MTVGTVVLGIILPIIPVVLLGALGIWLTMRFATNYGASWPSSTKLSVDGIALLTTFIVMVTCPIMWILLGILVGLVYGVAVPISNYVRRKNVLLYGVVNRRDDGPEQLTRWSIPLWILFFLLFLIVNAGGWLPVENVALKDGPIYTSQVLSTDHDWTVLLFARRIVILRSEDVKSRQPCSWGSHIMQLLYESPIDFNRKPNPRCAGPVTERLNPSSPPGPVIPTTTSVPATTTHHRPLP